MKDYSRKPRTYKASDEVYNAAMKRAKNEKTTVANVMERALWDYASNHLETIFEQVDGGSLVKLKNK